MSIDIVSSEPDSRDDSVLKREFAKRLYSGEDPSDIAADMFPDDFAFRMRVSVSWPSDSDVLDEFRKLSASGDSGVKAISLPTKNEHLVILYDIFKSNSNRVQDRLMASMQIAQFRGFVEKESSASSVVNNKVLVINRVGSDSDWEKKLIEQQDRLAKGEISIDAIETVADDVREAE